jgi:hypothetical protein
LLDPGAELARQSSDRALAFAYRDYSQRVSNHQSTISRLKRKLRLKRKAHNEEKLKVAGAWCVIKEQRATVQLLIAELKEPKDYLNSTALPPSDPGVRPLDPNDVSHRLLAEVNGFMDKDPHGRRYSKFMCDFGFGLHAHSPKAFAWVSNVWRLPAVTTVLHSIETERAYVAQALGKDRHMPLSKYLQNCRDREGIHPDYMVRATLPFDATPVSSKGIRGWAKESNFIFMMLPLDYQLPNAVLKSVEHPQGHIDQGMRGLTDEILAVMK